MTRHRPRLLARIEPTLEETSLAASPFAAFLLHRHDSCVESPSSNLERPVPLRQGSDGTARAASTGRSRLGR